MFLNEYFTELDKKEELEALQELEYLHYRQIELEAEALEVQNNPNNKKLSYSPLQDLDVKHVKERKKNRKKEDNSDLSKNRYTILEMIKQAKLKLNHQNMHGDEGGLGDCEPRTYNHNINYDDENDNIYDTRILNSKKDDNKQMTSSMNLEHYDMNPRNMQNFEKKQIDVNENFSVAPMESIQLISLGSTPSSNQTRSRALSEFLIQSQTKLQKSELNDNEIKRNEKAKRFSSKQYPRPYPHSKIPYPTSSIRNYNPEANNTSNRVEDESSDLNSENAVCSVDGGTIYSTESITSLATLKSVSKQKDNNTGANQILRRPNNSYNGKNGSIYTIGNSKSLRSGAIPTKFISNSPNSNPVSKTKSTLSNRVQKSCEIYSDRRRGSSYGHYSPKTSIKFTKKRPQNQRTKKNQSHQGNNHLPSLSAANTSNFQTKMKRIYGARISAFPHHIPPGFLFPNVPKKSKPFKI